jgi:hypothetical protein
VTVFSILAHQRLDGFAILQTLTDTPIEVGQSITVAGCGHGLNGTHTVLLCPQYAYDGVESDTGQWTFNGSVPRANQLLFASEGDTLEWEQDIHGTVTWNPTCTWITSSQIEDYLGLTLTGVDDATFLTQCAAAANAFAYRRRSEAGYLQDSLTTSPGGDVTLGTIMIGAAYFRQRGSFNSIASFDGMGVAPATGITPMVMQLLGINRPQVA